MAPPQTDLRIVPAGEAAPPVQGNVGGRSVTVYESPYACLVSTLTENEEGPYLYGAFFLHFPPGIERTANGEKEAAIFTLRDRDAPYHAGNGGSGDGIVRMARCVFPASDAARNMLRRKLAQFGPGSWVGTRVIGDGDGGDNQSPPVPPAGASTTASTGTVSTTSSSWTCTQYIDYFICMYDPETGQFYDCTYVGSECNKWEYEGSGGGWDPGGGGGSGGDPDPCDGDPSGGGGIPIECYHPPPCEEPDAPVWCEDPCETGDSVVDDTGVQQEFERLWAERNADAPNYQDRRETISILVPVGGGGYHAITFDDNAYSHRNWHEARILTSNITPGAILVHCHPFSHGETYFDTRQQTNVRHISGPSEPDRRALTFHGFDRGIVLERDRMFVFTPQSSEPYERCGY